MLVKNFIENFKSKKVMNTQIAPNAISDHIKKELEVKTYLPFRIKREVVEMVVNQNIKEVDGVKKSDSINQYISFIVAMLTSHTNLEFGDDPVTDYDLLAESGLLPQIIAEFQESYNECDILLKMALAMELEDNSLNVLVGKFLDNILKRLDIVGEVLKDKLGDFDIKSILGEDFNNENLAKLKGFLDKYNK